MATGTPDPACQIPHCDLDEPEINSTLKRPISSADTVDSFRTAQSNLRSDASRRLSSASDSQGRNGNVERKVKEENTECCQRKGAHLMVQVGMNDTARVFEGEGCSSGVISMRGLEQVRESGNCACVVRTPEVSSSLPSPSRRTVEPSGPVVMMSHTSFASRGRNHDGDDGKAWRQQEAAEVTEETSADGRGLLDSLRTKVPSTSKKEAVFSNAEPFRRKGSEMEEGLVWHAGNFGGVDEGKPLGHLGRDPGALHPRRFSPASPASPFLNRRAKTSPRVCTEHGCLEGKKSVGLLVRHRRHPQEPSSSRFQSAPNIGKKMEGESLLHSVVVDLQQRLTQAEVRLGELTKLRRPSTSSAVTGREDTTGFEKEEYGDPRDGDVSLAKLRSYGSRGQLEDVGVLGASPAPSHVYRDGASGTTTTIEASPATADRVPAISVLLASYTSKGSASRLRESRPYREPAGFIERQADLDQGFELPRSWVDPVWQCKLSTQVRHHRRENPGCSAGNPPALYHHHRPFPPSNTLTSCWSRPRCTEPTSTALSPKYPENMAMSFYSNHPNGTASRGGRAHGGICTSTEGAIDEAGPLRGMIGRKQRLLRKVKSSSDVFPPPSGKAARPSSPPTFVSSSLSSRRRPHRGGFSPKLSFWKTSTPSSAASPPPPTPTTLSSPPSSPSSHPARRASQGCSTRLRKVVHTTKVTCRKLSARLKLA